jgi:ribosome-binding factor A
VYVALRGDEAAQERTMRALDRSLPRMRRELARNLELRFVPTLSLRVDRSFDYADRIHRLLDRIHEEDQKA